MKLDQIVKAVRKLSRPYRVTDGKGFHLDDVPPADTGGLEAADKPAAAAAGLAGAAACGCAA